MDRDRLQTWLESQHKTFRWNDGEDSAHYEGVSTSDEGLEWFRWSHIFEPGGNGKFDVTHQSFDEFRRDGPPREMPDGLRDELVALVAELTA